MVHRLLEQFELIHVELLLLLACTLGSHAPARRVAVTVFIFNGQVFDFEWSSRVTVPTRNCGPAPGCFAVPNSTSRGPSVTTLSS